MLTVGITGRSGSGKSSVSAHYAALGYPVANGDAMARGVTRPGSACLAELVDAFGPGILFSDGSLDRPALAALAFSSPQRNKQLVSITHPYILKAFLAQAENARKNGSKLLFTDGAMIVGGLFQPYCDKIIVVVAEEKLSVSRIILRDGISKTAVYARLSAQLPEAALRKAADYLIENNGSLHALHQNADAVLQKLILLAEGG